MLLMVAVFDVTGSAFAHKAPSAAPQTVDILKQLIAFRTVAGPGNQTPEAAAYLRGLLISGGFDAEDVAVEPFGNTAYLVARYRGRDDAAAPLVLLGHLDVVVADPKDWTRDPFLPVIENGFIFGRGATDMKLGNAALVAALIALKNESFVPYRDVALVLSGDEETGMKTSRILAERFGNAFAVINAEGGGGKLSEQTGEPEFFAFTAAEKTYADFRLTVTDPGGHSSEPRPKNAIATLSRALARIAEHRFKPELNDISRVWLEQAAHRSSPRIAAAMRAFAENPGDEAAIAVLAAEPAYVGRIGTTCVPTMVSGGHAENALPQRASAVVNCRLFPGRTYSDTMAELQRVAAEKDVMFEDLNGRAGGATPPSPLREDVVAAIHKAVTAEYPNIAVIPEMASGATDNLWFRLRGVPSYGVGLTFMKSSDDLSHGLNERTPLSNIAPAVRAYTSIIRDLAQEH